MKLWILYLNYKAFFNHILLLWIKFDEIFNLPSVMVVKLHCMLLLDVYT
jgi:hypothetical protein